VKKGRMDEKRIGRMGRMGRIGRRVGE